MKDFNSGPERDSSNPEIAPPVACDEDTLTAAFPRNGREDVTCLRADRPDHPHVRNIVGQPTCAALGYCLVGVYAVE